MNVHEPPNIATLSASLCPKVSLFLKLQIGIAADMLPVTEMLNDFLLTFRERVEIGIKALLRNISQVIVHGNDS